MKTLFALVSRLSFLRFAIVGVLGVPVNLGTLYVMINWARVGTQAAGIIAWCVAVTFTWAGNRYFTFRQARARGLTGTFWEWVRFVAANGVGGLINIGIYLALISFAGSPLNNPYLAQICGILAGLVFNFTLSKMLVFKTPARRSDPPSPI